MTSGKVDISFIEIEVPENRWCSSGHVAPEYFKREGANGPDEPTKFFKVISKDIDISICEPCLIVANHIAKEKRKLK